MKHNLIIVWLHAGGAPSASVTDQHIPQWQLRCKRETELNELYMELTSILHDAAKQVSLPTSLPFPFANLCASQHVFFHGF